MTTILGASGGVSWSKDRKCWEYSKKTPAGVTGGGVY